MFGLVGLVALFTTACVDLDPDGDKTARILNVEDINYGDLQYMKEHYKNDYRWYQSSILLKDYLDVENQTSEVAEITNIFMIITDPDKSYDTNIIMFRHTLEDDDIDIIPSLWIEEDVNIKENYVEVKFKDAVKKARESKPILHTKRVVLRKHLGPLDINPQWTFGNNHGLVFIDATYGTLSTEQPAFRGTGFQTWYGEWPN